MGIDAPQQAAPPHQAQVDAAPLRVLVVTPKGFVGGAERWLLSVLESTRRLEATVVVLDEGPLVDDLRARGAAVEALPTGAGASDIAAASAQLRRVLQRLQPDAVLASGIKAATVVAAPATAMGVPWVWVRHDPSFEQTLQRVTARLADRTITVSPPAPGQVVDDGTVMIKPPLLHEPLPRPDAEAALRASGVPDDGLLRLGMVTRLVPYKGVDTVLRALALPGGQGWRLVVAGIDDPGAPDEGARLAALAAELDVADRVCWLGEVPRAGRLAGAFDAVALPTRAGEPGYPNSEGYGLALIEALAAGVPVIADPVTAPPLREPDVAAGCVPVDARDPGEVATALSELTDASRRAAVAERAAHAGIAHPRAADVADDVVSVLAEAAHRPGAGLTRGPAFTVVTTVLNERDGIDTLITAVLAQASADDEVVVVDGGSSDGTQAAVEAAAARDGRVRLIVAPGAGISEGRNIGIRAARTEWIACTDCGCEPVPGWLAGMRRAAASGRYQLVTGVYRAGRGLGRDWERALAVVAYPSPEELRRRTPLVRAYGRVFGRAYDATLPTGRSIAFTKAAAEAAGGFPEHLATAEDVKFGLAAVEAGARPVLSLDAEVTWEQRPTLASNGRMFRGYGRGDGRSHNALLVGRNLARAGAYAAAPLLLRRRPGRALLVVGGAAYLSLPLARALGCERPGQTAAWVAPLAAYRDLTKALGCAEGLWAEYGPTTRDEGPADGGG